jgi:type I restriction enzyme S subunit
MEGQELPVGWSSMELNDAGIWGSGGTPSRKNPRYYENGTIPWLVIGDLNDQAVEEFSTSITELGLINSSAKLIPTGSLLVAMYGSIGKLGITTFPCTTNQAIAFCIPNEELVELRYLFHALANAKPELIAKGQGGAQQNISQGILKEHLIPLSPLNEQRRIAAKLDTTLAAVEACRQRLDDVAAILKRFRQAVLSAATSGELTQGWREENFVDGKWDEGCLHELLSSKPRNGYSPKPADQETPIKSLTLSATTTGRFKPEHFKYIDQSIPVDSHLWLTPGDILIQRANTLEYVGISAIYNGPEKTFIYPDLMMKCQANGKVDTQYLHYLLLSEAVRNYFRESATGTSGNMPKINQQIVMSAPVRWPTYDEQLEIVERAQELFTLADQVESKLTVASTIVDRLTPALLAKAFRGELVPQDPNDEPASELLTKLKANQSNAAQVSPRRRAKQHTLRQTMSISGKDSIKAAILSLEYDRFSFDELRDQVGGDYESLKGILFELLEEQSPIVRQFFDQEAKAMKLERIRR